MEPKLSSEPPRDPQLHRIEAIRLAQYDAWQQGNCISVEQLISQFGTDELNEDEWLELILSEHALQKASGRHVETEQYLQRFPNFRQRLKQLFAMDAELDATPPEEMHRPVDGDAITIVQPMDQPSILSKDTSQDSDDRHNIQVTTEAETESTGLAVGMRVGKYKLVSRLGQGGMGTVFRASHSLIDRQVALKVMLPQLVRKRDLQERFLKEAQLCVNLHHPNLVRTLDVDQDNGCLFLTMELLNGRNLSEHVNTQGVVTSEVAANIIRQAAEGLAHAHDQGIIHRDIKPQNIMLEGDGRVKVLDLGLAKLRGEYIGTQLDSEDSGQPNKDWLSRLSSSLDEHVTLDGCLTYHGTILGTVAFMSPEQAVNSSAVDARSDIYSLGCTAYFLLTGQLIYGNTSSVEILREKISGKQRDLEFGAMPAKWQNLIQRMTAWNVNDRIATMGKLIEELDRLFFNAPVWLPSSDNLEELRSKLIEYALISPTDWQEAQAALYEPGATMAWNPHLTTRSLGVSTSQTPAYEFLLHLTKSVSRETGESMLTQFQVQQILAGHIDGLQIANYTIREFLNSGWKGEVLKCRNKVTKRNEAVRSIAVANLLGLEKTALISKQLDQAIETLSRHEHPNIARTYAADIVQDVALITSEYIQGKGLGTEIRTHGHFGDDGDPVLALRSAIDMAAGVAYLHQQGVLHLDLSSERWVRCVDGRLCLLDAGMAALVLPRQWEDIPQSTGMPPIIAPEMIGNLQAASPAADVYALGQVYRFLRTGKFPFKSMKFGDLPRPRVWPPVASASAVGNETMLRSSTTWKAPRTSEDAKVQWHEAFDKLVQRMIEKDVSQRIQSVDEVLAELVRIQAALPGYPMSGPSFLVRIGKRIQQVFKRGGHRS